MADDYGVDVRYDTVLEWLVSTQQAQAKWQDKLRVVHAHIAKALEELPTAVEAPTVEGDDSLSLAQCEQVRDRVVAWAESIGEGGLTLFRNYKNAHAHRWTQIVKAYKRGNLHVVDAGRRLIQRGKYIIPGMKTTLTQHEKSVAVATRKAAETRRQINQLKRKQRKEYGKLRIPGRNYRKELLATVSELPVHTYNLDAACRVPAIPDAMAFYAAFVEWVSNAEAPKVVVAAAPAPAPGGRGKGGRRGKKGRKGKGRQQAAQSASDADASSAATATSTAPVQRVSQGPTLRALTELQAREPVPKAELDESLFAADAGDSDDEGAGDDATGSGAGAGAGAGAEEATVAAAEDDGDDLDLDWDFSQLEIEGEGSALEMPGGDGGIAWDMGGAEVDWDGGGVIAEASAGAGAGAGAGGDAQGWRVDEAQVQRLVNDLQELQAFLNQRLGELSDSAGTAFFDQFADAPDVVRRHTSASTVRQELEAVAAALQAARSPRLLELIMIRESGRYLDRLVERLERQETTRLRLEGQLEDLEQQAADAQRLVAQAHPRLRDMVADIKQLTRSLEAQLTTLTKREVHITGDINQLTARTN